MILESYYKEGDKAAFLAKLQTICGRLGLDPSWLMIAMYKESGLKPGAYNASSRATGLIQFLPSTAKGLGTSVEALRLMTGVQQLDYVEKYLTPYKGRFGSFVDAYLAIFYPKAVGKGELYVIARKGTLAYELNKGMDRNPDTGKLSVLDVKVWLQKHLPAEASAYIDALKKKNAFS